MNLATKFTVIRLMLIPLFFLFATPISDGFAKQSVFLDFMSNNGIYISVSIFIIAAVTDKIDGFIARKYNQITKLGIFLDPLADKLMITAALILLIQKNQVSSLIAIIIIGRELAVTGLRLAAAQKKLVLSADKFGKIKLVSQVVAIVAVMLNNYPFSVLSTFRIYNVLMYIAVVFTTLSGFNYFYQNRFVFIDDTSNHSIYM